jgi:molybdopterin-guanine dinucleotide biosynthesis protein B
VAVDRMRKQNGMRMKIFGFAGWSGSGKTTLIEKLIPHFNERGMSVSMIKRAHHNFDVDVPGKDSWRHRQAGCQEVLVSSTNRWALMHELRGGSELTLDECIDRMSPCDLLLVEGNKHSPLPKLEVWREANGKPLLHPEDPHIVGIASDAARDVAINPGLPRFGLEEVPAIADFILQHAREN